VVVVCFSFVERIVMLTKQEIEALVILLTNANVPMKEAAFWMALLTKLQEMHKEAE
jgi:type IV secretory pathway VirB3-like protein